MPQHQGTRQFPLEARSHRGVNLANLVPNEEVDKVRRITHHRGGQRRPRLAMRHPLSLPGSARTAHAPRQAAVNDDERSPDASMPSADSSRGLTWILRQEFA